MRIFTLPDGRLLHYEIFGDAGPPVVLLHGYLDSHSSFFRLFDALRTDFTVYALDQRGHGDSDPAPDYGIAGFTADALAFIAGLGVGPVHLAGHSLGGIVAQRVVSARPDLVRSLGLISTGRDAVGNPALMEVRPLLAALDGDVPEPLLREFQESTTFQKLPEEILEIYLAATRKVRLPVWQGALEGLLTGAAPAEPPCAVPAIIIWGKEDGLFDAASQAALRAHYPAARFIAYDSTGHAPNWERPAEVAAALQQFWTDCETK
jgi:pimeloyl-ACP methyl ester carboxylesterase